ncbi:MAG: helix-turn-helix transcriptional regulator [Bacteroidales bacterium]|nr:helix-turn-helix transcriptional regulator [Bacteroidales bacterium]
MQRLEELDMSQKELSDKMNCSPQYVSKLLKGSENLTLETISKLEECLHLDLVQSALTHVGSYAYRERSYGYVAEPSPPPYGRKDE